MRLNNQHRTLPCLSMAAALPHAEHFTAKGLAIKNGCPILPSLKEVIQ